MWLGAIEDEIFLSYKNDKQYSSIKDQSKKYQQILLLWNNFVVTNIVMSGVGGICTSIMAEEYFLCLRFIG